MAVNPDSLIFESFVPPFWAKNRHVQSLLGTLKFRRPILIKQSAALLNQSREMILEAHDGIRLQSFYSPHKKPSKKLAILLHGWEGSHESLYLLSAANTLFQAGYDVLRLNLRDHGTSHHLNEEIFHSNRLQEVLDSIQFVQQELKPESTMLIGFSLGGNFACRVAENATKNTIQLNNTIAICPAINPEDSLNQMENGLRFYHDYFVKKWKRSLFKKEKYFPEIYQFDDIRPMKSMRQITDHLLNLFGDYDSKKEYFNGYSLAGERLKNLDQKISILVTKDDPVLHYRDTLTLAENPNLKIHVSQFGGHCGFIKNIKLRSWADEFILREVLS